MPSTCRARNPWLRGFIALLFTADTVTAACYYPNGTDRNAGFSSDIYYPINPGDDASMCCSQNGDQPRTDGLCTNSLGTIVWRESCTDKTWASPKCIKLCAGTSTDTHSTPGTGRQMDNDEKVMPCPDGSYCCGDGALGYTCCSEGRGVFLRDGTTQATNPSSTIASSSSSPMTAGVPAGTTTDAASSRNPPTSPPSPNVDGGAIAGIVIGGLAGIVLLLVASWLVLRKRRKGQEAARNGMVSQQGYPPTSPNPRWPNGNYTNTKPQEVQGSYAEDYKRSELHAGPVSWTAGRSELDGEQQYFPIVKRLDSANLDQDKSDGHRQ
ncbi:MAG: hypothetical protein LQ337_002393 [Flavoplaca oasis]|nr:MAG: hypothetical protein LQ337_002393 [Flavoplaca oasis]